MNEQNWYLTSTEIFLRYSEMKSKSEIPKFSQKSKKEKQWQRKIRVLFDSYLKQNQNELIPLKTLSGE